MSSTSGHPVERTYYSGASKIIRPDGSVEIRSPVKELDKRRRNAPVVLAENNKKQERKGKDSLEKSLHDVGVLYTDATTPKKEFQWTLRFEKRYFEKLGMNKKEARSLKAPRYNRLESKNPMMIRSCWCKVSLQDETLFACQPKAPRHMHNRLECKNLVMNHL
jgi:hypothetical protein